MKARARRILDDDDDFEDQDIGVPDLAIKKKVKKSKILATTTSAKVVVAQPSHLTILILMMNV